MLEKNEPIAKVIELTKKPQEGEEGVLKIEVQK